MWNPFRRVLSTNTPNKRKRDETNASDSNEEPRASRRKAEPKTPSPRKSQDPQSARKENVKPKKSASPETVAATKNSAGSLFTGGDETWVSRSLAKSKPGKNEPVEEEAASNGSHNGSDADVGDQSFASDNNAEVEETEAEDIYSTIERDDDNLEAATTEADDEFDGEEDPEFEPEHEDVENHEPESQLPEDNEPAAMKPRVKNRGVKGGSRKEDPTYRPDPRELADEDGEVELPSEAKDPKGKTPIKKPRAAITSSPMIRKEAFDRDDVRKEDMMDVIPESDEEPESDWEIDGNELETYKDGIKDIPSHNAWCREDKKLHKTLFLRGLHPLMPTTWHFDFLGYPITPEIFAPLSSKKKVLIYNASEKGQFRTTKALCAIFDLQGRVTALRQIGANDKISPLITKELNRYIKTVMTEAGLTKYEFAPTIRVRRIDNKRIEKKNIAKTVEDYFIAWAEKHRKWYDEHKLKAPRLLYGFVVVQHAVMLLTIDSARPDAKPRPFSDFSMSAEQQWLDSSLNIAIPIFLARERLLKLAPTFPLAPPPESDHDDD